MARTRLQEVMATHGARVQEAGNKLRRLEVCAHLPARFLVVLPSSMLGAAAAAGSTTGSSRGRLGEVRTSSGSSAMALEWRPWICKELRRRLGQRTDRAE